MTNNKLGHQAQPVAQYAGGGLAGRRRMSSIRAVCRDCGYRGTNCPTRAWGEARADADRHRTETYQAAVAS